MKPVDNTTACIKVEVNNDSSNTIYGEPANVTLKTDASDVKQLLNANPIELADASIKNEPADVNVKRKTDINMKVDVADVGMEWSLNLANVKQELDTGLTVLQPPDALYMPRPCKPEPADTTLLSKRLRSYPPARRHIAARKESPVNVVSSQGSSSHFSTVAGGPGTPNTGNSSLRPKVEIEPFQPIDPEVTANLDLADSRPDNQSAVSESFGDFQDLARPTLFLPAITKSHLDFREQAGTTPVSLAAPPLGDVGSDSDDDFEELPLTVLPRTVNTVKSFAAPDPERDPEVVAFLDDVAASQDDADESILPQANNTYDWTPDYATYRGIKEVFTVDTPGPTKENVTPYENFCEIWDEHIMKHIANMTNLYAKQEAAQTDEDGTNDGINRWKPTDIDELYVYFAVLMYMAIDPRTPLTEYWRKGSPLEMQTFQTLMTYNRFVMLSTMLHFVDVTEKLPADQVSEVAKMRPIIDHCNEKFQSLYVPNQDIAIDESLTLWNRHVGWVQNIMSKASHCDIKSYELCESSTGYLWKFIIYSGNHSDIGEINLTGTALVGKTSHIVLTLMTDLLLKGYCLTMDKFYSNPALVRHLKSVGVDCVGTIRKMRKNVPDEFKQLDKTSIDRGAVVARHCGDISLLAWNGAELVVTISTYHNDEMYLDRCGGRPLMKPIVIKDYNSAMGGVDLKERNLSKYLMQRKCTTKGYIRMFRRLMNASVFNSFIMYRSTMEKLGRGSPKHRDFRYDLARELIERHLMPPPMIQRPLAMDEVHCDEGANHFLYPIKSAICARCIFRENSNCKVCKYTRRRCIWCSSSKRIRFTWNECRKCAKSLCVGSCFATYHARTFSAREDTARKPEPMSYK